MTITDPALLALTQKAIDDAFSARVAVIMTTLHESLMGSSAPSESAARANFERWLGPARGWQRRVLVRQNGGRATRVAMMA